MQYFEMCLYGLNIIAGSASFCHPCYRCYKTDLAPFYYPMFVLHPSDQGELR
jgi:hypothetical protein